MDPPSVDVPKIPPSYPGDFEVYGTKAGIGMMLKLLSFYPSQKVSSTHTKDKICMTVSEIEI